MALVYCFIYRLRTCLIRSWCLCFIHWQQLVTWTTCPISQWSCFTLSCTTLNTPKRMYVQSSPTEGHRFVSSTWKPSTISSKTPTTFMYVKFALRWLSSQKHVSHCCRFLISIRLCTWLCWSHQIHMITCRCCWRSCLAFCRLLSRIICVMAFSWFLSCSIRSYWKRERRRRTLQT